MSKKIFYEVKRGGEREFYFILFLKNRVKSSFHIYIYINLVEKKISTHDDSRHFPNYNAFVIISLISYTQKRKN